MGGWSDKTKVVLSWSWSWYISSQLLVRVSGEWVVGGWSDKTKVILKSTQVEMEVGIELGNKGKSAKQNLNTISDLQVDLK